MDSRNPSPDDRAPTHDPAGSSMPPIPIPDGADVPEWKRERKAGNGVTSCNAVREALLKVLRALDLDLSPEVVGTLRALEYHGPDYVDAVLRSLDDLVAGQ